MELRKLSAVVWSGDGEDKIEWDGMGWDGVKDTRLRMMGTHACSTKTRHSDGIDSTE